MKNKNKKKIRRLQIFLMGERNAGKRELIKELCEDSYEDYHLSKIGIDSFCKRD